MIAFFANIFGYLLNFLYNLFNNYGVAIILFSIVIKLLMLPISIKQQRSMKKNNKIQKEMKQLQFKYKNDPQKLNQETMALYQREKMSPLSGCFSAIVQIVLLFSVFYLVRSPLTYMKKLDTEIINKYIDDVKEAGLDTNVAYNEIDVIREIENIRLIEKGEYKVSENNEENQEKQTEENTNTTENGEEKEAEEDNINENKEELNENKENSDENKENETKNINDEEIDKEIDSAYINMEFLGLDLSKVPSQSLNDPKVYVIPVLYVISSFISIKITSNMQKKAKEEAKSENTEENDEENNENDMMEQTNKTMSLMMPIMSISIASIAPLGLALYWLINNILMILERTVLDKFIKDDDK